ncbi:FHA domain-containing protein [Cellulomonas sp. DKR-3]|uniref:FHA domain-containing protein n=1 Tax=Cellulomonas fulva TaxID=2835530 RepID=A0ABS5TZ16_9CELL|nr:FHA domain-containing protein [Cellulomonas fulva]MBT0994256.1 FHA domain-containing protein [Cellulomonas fulva]
MTPVVVVEAQPPVRSRRATPRPATSGQRAGQRATGAATAGAVPLGVAFDGVRTVPVGLRLAAYLVDALVVLAVAAAVLLATGRLGYAVLAAAELVIGLVVWEARTGCTFGNLALGLRAARAEAPYAPGLGRGALRSLVLLAGHAVAGVGQLVVLGSAGFDRSGLRQGWHDRAGRAVVVDVRGPRTTGAGLRAPVAAGAAPGVTPTPRPAVDGAAAYPSAVAPPAAVPGTAAAVAPVLPGSGGTAPAPWAPAVPSGAGGSPSASSASSGPAASSGPGPGSRPSAPTVFVLTLDTGEAMTVSGPGVIGRAPRPITGERCDHVVVIDDPERSLSRTHARFGIDARGFWVADAGSGNGTVVVLPSGQTAVVEADRPVPVPSGSTVRLGDREVVVEALRAA